MPRKRLAALAVLACAALTAAGVAAASHRSQSTQAAAATFTANSVSHISSKTCTASDGSYRETKATYGGTASSSDARLNGTLTIRAHSVVNTTTGLGWLDASYRVRGGAHGTVHAAVSGGNAVGAITGAAGRPQGKLVASFASAFTQDGGFSSGSLGTGTVNGAGIVFQRGSCSRAKAGRTVMVSPLRFGRQDKARASGSLTFDVTRDTNGAITSAKAVFYVNYRFDAPVTITGLTLDQGAKGVTGPVVIDATTGSITDPDGNGNLTQIVIGVSGADAQAVLSNPRGYYVELTTNGPALRAQLARFNRR